jgi:hypothetical protein
LIKAAKYCEITVGLESTSDKGKENVVKFHEHRLSSALLHFLTTTSHTIRPPETGIRRETCGKGRMAFQIQEKKFRLSPVRLNIQKQSRQVEQNVLLLK